MKTLEYPLLALTLTESECNSIVAPILSGGLPRMGMTRSMARTLVYAPLKYQGIGINKLYTTQGLLHINALVNHIWRESETGKLLRISLEYVKLELGIQGSLFAKDYALYCQLCEDSWIKHLWKFLCENGILIEDSTDEFELVREGDSLLTEHFASACRQGKITKSEWKRANRCRIYLKVMTVGDIATGHGYAIDDACSKGILQQCRQRKLDWPFQGRPHQRDWCLWR